MNNSRIWSLALSVAVLLASTVTFTLTTFATKHEVQTVKAEVQKDVDEKHAEVKQQITQNHHQTQQTLKVLDGRLWQVLNEIKKIRN